MASALDRVAGASFSGRRTTTAVERTGVVSQFTLGWCQVRSDTGKEAICRRHEKGKQATNIMYSFQYPDVLVAYTNSFHFPTKCRDVGDPTHRPA